MPEYCPREGVSSLRLRSWTARLETCDTARVFAVGILVSDLAGALEITHGLVGGYASLGFVLARPKVAIGVYSSYSPAYSH
jgi:hypothetical protein